MMQGLIRIQFIGTLFFWVMTGCHSSIALAATVADFEWGLGLGGGQTIGQMSQKTAAFYTGENQLYLGAAWESGYHLDFLMEGVGLRPDESFPVMKTLAEDEYRMDFGFLGARFGKRWSRAHLWGEVGIGNMEESYDQYEYASWEHPPTSSLYGSLGVGAGFEVYKSKGFSLELYAHVRELSRPWTVDLSQPISRNMTAQTYGLLLNFHPSEWNTDRGTGDNPTWGYAHCSCCWGDPIRLLIEVGRLTPRLGAGLTRSLFMALR